MLGLVGVVAPGAEVARAVVVADLRLKDKVNAGSDFQRYTSLLPQDSLLGRLLHTLVGYTDRPTELQLIAYVATLTVIAVMTWLAAPPRRTAGAVA